MADTREEKVAKMAALRAEVEELTKTFNEANQSGNVDAANRADLATEEKVNEYTSIARDVCFDDCKNSGDPMMAAVRQLTFATIATKDTKDGDDKVPVREVIDKNRPINLLKLDKYCGGIGVDKKWPHIAQKVNCLLTMRTCKELGIDYKTVADSYNMSQIAKDIDMGKTPTSNTQILKLMTSLITAMIGGEYKPTSHDVAYLLQVYARKQNGKALTLVCSNHKYFVGYMAEVAYRIVHGFQYEVSYKTKKDDA